MRHRYLLLLLGIFLLRPLSAQSDWERKALAAFTGEDWSVAIKSYKKYLKQSSQDSLAWFNLAVSQLRQEKYSEALASFDQAKTTGFDAGRVYFGRSKCYAGLGAGESVLEELSQAAESGFTGLTRLDDQEYDFVRETPKFEEVIERVKRNIYPCLGISDMRHFDFWIGEWDVYSKGNKIGENSITMANGGCAIHESYTTPRGYTGQSINYYDIIDKKWHQHWVGSSGDMTNYLESDREDKMLQFVGKIMLANGNIILNRMTFTYSPDEMTVRQLIESSRDDGETWFPSFDGLYKKKVN